MAIDNKIRINTKVFDLSEYEWDAVKSMHDLDAVTITDLKSYLVNANISNNYLARVSPFVIDINNSTQIIITKLIRVLPNRRMVFCGVLKTSVLEVNIVLKKIIFKIFVDENKFKKDHNAILDSYNNLLNAGLTTPKIVSSTIDDKSKFSCFVYNYIASDRLLSTNNKYKIIIEAIAKLHNNNFIQKDLHFDNFIISNNQLYFIDIQSIDYDNNNDINNRKLDNFSLFLAQLPIKEHVNWKEHINYYFSCLLNKDIINHIDDRVKIFKLAYSKCKSRVSNFINKCQRDSTSFETISNTSCFTIIKRIHDDTTNDFIKEFVKCQQTVISKYGIKVIKDGNTAKVWLLSYNNKSFIVKHYLPGKNYISNLYGNLKSIVTGRRAINSWVFANVLEHVGVGVSSPVTVLLNKHHNIITDSYFVMEYDNSFVRADQILKSDKTSKFYSEDKDIYITQIKRLLEIFNTLQIVHNDFKDVNIGFVNNKIIVLDLDAMQSYKSRLFFNLRRNKDRKRFLKCFEKDSEVTQLFNK